MLNLALTRLNIEAALNIFVKVAVHDVFQLWGTRINKSFDVQHFVDVTWFNVIVYDLGVAKLRGLRFLRPNFIDIGYDDLGNHINDQQKHDNVLNKPGPFEVAVFRLEFFQSLLIPTI